MKRIFKFKRGDYWEWDCSLMSFLNDQLSDEDENHGAFPRIKHNTKITIIVEKKKPKNVIFHVSDARNLMPRKVIFYAKNRRGKKKRITFVAD